MASQPELAGRVEFTGHVTEAEKNLHLCTAHLLIHTSVREGWGLNVIEANAMGTPAIVYPVGGLVDSTVHRETGLITEGETPSAVADSVIELLQNPNEYERLRFNAWNRSKTFQWPHVLQMSSDWLEKQAANTERLSKR
jgi:glycosyltransferase involved in cell wall biosynthesis